MSAHEHPYAFQLPCVCPFGTAHRHGRFPRKAAGNPRNQTNKTQTNEQNANKRTNANQRTKLNGRTTKQANGQAQTPSDQRALFHAARTRRQDARRSASAAPYWRTARIIRVPSCCTALRRRLTVPCSASTTRGRHSTWLRRRLWPCAAATMKSPTRTASAW